MIMKSIEIFLLNFGLHREFCAIRPSIHRYHHEMGVNVTATRLTHINPGFGIVVAGGLCVRAQCLRFQEFLKIFSPLSALRAGSEKILRNSWKRTHDECYDNNVTKFLTVYFLPVVYRRHWYYTG